MIENGRNLPHVSDQEVAEHKFGLGWPCDLMTSITVCQGVPRQRSFNTGKSGPLDVKERSAWLCFQWSRSGGPSPPFLPTVDSYLAHLNIILTSHDNGTRPDVVPKRTQPSSQGPQHAGRDCVCPGVCDKGISCSKPDGHSNCIG